MAQVQENLELRQEVVLDILTEAGEVEGRDDGQQVIGVRVLIATYKPEVLDLVGSAANKAKWAVKRVVNPTPVTKKKT